MIPAQSLNDVSEQSGTLTATTRVVSEPRKLLLIDYHFGNGRATGGFRWNAMARDLTKLGWLFEVITQGASAIPEERAPGIRVHTVPAPTLLDDAVRLASSVKRRIRGLRRSDAPRVAAASPIDVGTSQNSGVGRMKLYDGVAAAVDAIRLTGAEWIWTRRARTLGHALLRRNSYAAIIVSSPPHFTQRAAASLARATSIPYVADFRDPWVFGRPEKYDINLLANRLGQILEPPTLRRASLIFGNTDHARAALASLYPGLARRIMSVPNGYDLDEELPRRPDPTRFRIIFAGCLYPFMDPRPVLAAAGRLRRRADLGPQSLSVDFMGTGEPDGPGTLVALAERCGLADCFHLLPTSERDEATRLQSAAAVLVAFDASTQLAMPSKFYDYSRMGGTMLLIGFADGAMAAAAATLGVKVYHPNDSDGIDALLDEAYRRWQAGEMIPQPDRAAPFDRRRQSRRVHDALLALCG